ncbi:alpha/beta fold hydrolase [Massilia jejuensis]|uniref:Alpha/beta fold hydrolase n=1 Tax=Massilia jejuensis TaxID=648894 RepID=A0ABW0PGH9_9BURK
MSLRLPTVFIPALLCDEMLYRDVIAVLGDVIEPQVLMSPQANLADSAADILARAPRTFALVGTSYGANVALAIALAAPERVSSLWLMGCDASAPAAGGPDLAAGLDATPDAIVDFLAGIVVRPADHAASAAFKAMAHRVGAPAGAAQARALASRDDIWSRLSELRMPALILTGDEDPIAPPARGQQLAQVMPHARFELMQQCGHLPSLEQPARAAALFHAFLGENAPQPHPAR